MAMGVGKTYRKEYYKHLKAYLQLKLDMEEEEAIQVITDLKNNMTTPVSMGNKEAFARELTGYGVGGKVWGEDLQKSPRIMPQMQPIRAQTVRPIRRWKR